MSFIVWREPVVKRVLYGNTGMVGRFFKSRGNKLQNMARTQVGGNTGLLRSSIHMRHYKDPRGHMIRVGSNVTHARVHHEGTPPRLIKPDRPDGVLRFVTKGQVVYANLVRHPGTKANKYLTDNLRRVFADTR